ncbi:nicotinamide riboside transporter PnuC [Flaviaesturariibacter amylovorans]|uniref:Nicotinamide riboside transporter PnuC n=1 Tax=Flaviaesturariibacter amylovorans TaxID=1084520 RepID=A0ABP8HR00_9BACT
MQEFFSQFWTGLLNTTGLEFIAVIAGIVSVYFSRKENIWVYPVGLVNTGIYWYLCVKHHLFGEALVNLYYTYMSIWGWILWARRNERNEKALHITWSSRREWVMELLFFAFFFIAIWLGYQGIAHAHGLAVPQLGPAPSVWDNLEAQFIGYARSIPDGNLYPAADAFAAATAFTGMWLMARKKVESWYWWIATNVSSIPLYYVKGLVFTSVLFFILLIMAFWGLAEWKRKARSQGRMG